MENTLPVLREASKPNLKLLALGLDSSVYKIEASLPMYMGLKEIHQNLLRIVYFYPQEWMRPPLQRHADTNLKYIYMLSGSELTAIFHGVVARKQECDSEIRASRSISKCGL